MANFHVGQSFSSFSEFQKCLSSFENENFVKFFKRGSLKIESAVRAGKTKIELNANVRYYEVKYICVRGGRFRPEGTGKRKTSSCKIDCPAHIYLRASADGKRLEVKSFSNTHNHEISKVLFDHMPQQRQLTESEKSKARELIMLQANRKLIQQKLQEETGKIITLRDLSNLAKGVKSNSNDLHEAVSLQGKYHADVEVLRTEENVFFQTEGSASSNEGDVNDQGETSFTTVNTSADITSKAFEFNSLNVTEPLQDHIHAPLLESSKRKSTSTIRFRPLRKKMRPHGIEENNSVTNTGMETKEEMKELLQSIDKNLKENTDTLKQIFSAIVVLNNNLVTLTNSVNNTS